MITKTNQMSLKTLQILLPKSNKVLDSLLSQLNPKDLQSLTQPKDLQKVLQDLFKEASQNTQQNSKLLQLLQNNPTLRSLSTLTPTMQTAHNLLESAPKAPQLQQLSHTLERFLATIKDIDPKDLQQKFKDSGIFLESKPDNSNDLKHILQQAKEFLTTTADYPNKTQLLQTLDKLSLQIDYYQLLSYLSNAAVVYLPYRFDALKEGRITLRRSQEKHFFCDIDLILQEYGELHLRLGLFDEKILNITIQTQSNKLQNALKAQLQQLKSALSKEGLQVQNISFAQEKKSSPYSNDTTEEIHLGFEVKA